MPRREGPVALICYRCRVGSSRFYDEAIGKGPWDSVVCPECNASVLLAEAIDEMFINGSDHGYVLWAGCTVLWREIDCMPGRAVTLDLGVRFEDVYRVSIGEINGGGHFGLTAQIHQQRWLVAALGDPEPVDRPRHRVTLGIRVVGALEGEARLSGWRKILLDARSAAAKAPRYLPLEAFNALDAFTEEASAGSVRRRPPLLWIERLQSASIRAGRAMAAHEGKLRKLIAVRGSIAHNQDYQRSLPAEVRRLEQTWWERRHSHDLDSRCAPVDRWALHVALDAIRDSRQALET
jgi:hypothetical protein